MADPLMEAFENINSRLKTLEAAPKPEAASNDAIRSAVDAALKDHPLISRIAEFLGRWGRVG